MFVTIHFGVVVFCPRVGKVYRAHQQGSHFMHTIFSYEDMTLVVMPIAILLCP